MTYAPSADAHADRPQRLGFVGTERRNSDTAGHEQLGMFGHADTRAQRTALRAPAAPESRAADAWPRHCARTDTPPLAGRYRCVVIDPPWDQGKTGKRAVRPNQGTKLSYPTMTYDEIARLPIRDWAAPDAFIWLWATNSRSRSSGKPILMQAFQLLDHWGFQYYTALTWNKETGPCPFGPYQITNEHCLFGYRGKCVFPKDSMGKLKTVFWAPVRRHSEKPACHYDNIRRYFDGPRLDIFARRRHAGFDAWGDEVEQS